MITVHHLEMSRSQRVLWLLEELGLPYELKVYKRHPVTRLAPDELKAIHPLGKSPVITDGGHTVAESGVILEYLSERYGSRAGGDANGLGTLHSAEEAGQIRYWMHYAEGSLMPWLVMKLVFMTVPTQPMPFFVRPIAKALCSKVQHQLIDRQLATHMAFLEQHLATHLWFAGQRLSIADVQMSFVVEAALSRNRQAADLPHLSAYLQKVQARPAYQQALLKGGPVVMGA